MRISDWSSDVCSSDLPLAKARFVDVLRFIWHKPALIFLIAGCSLLGLISISLGSWAASFFVRVHGLSLSEVGLLLGIFGGLGGVVAPAVYGKLGDTLLPRNPPWPLRSERRWVGQECVRQC